MKSPATDPRLSKRAVGFFYFYLEIGRVISAEEASDRPDVSEGRDAIRSAMNELKLAGYITMEKNRVKGQFRTYWKFTNNDLNMPFIRITDDGLTDDGFSGSLYTDSSAVASTNTSTKSLSLKKDKVLRTLSLGTTSEGKVEMSWPFEEEQEDPKPRRLRISEEADASPGAVGKIEDRQKRLNDKYKKTKFEAVPKHMRRNERPEELWDSNDIIAEFYDLMRDAAPGTPGQMNRDHFRSWMHKMFGEGATRLGMLKAIRMFFADPRLLRDAGIGEPLWRRFVAYYPTIHGLVHRDEKPEGDDDALKKHQEKMLKLLEG